MSHSAYSTGRLSAYNGGMKATQTLPEITEINLPDVDGWRWESDYSEDFGYVVKSELLWTRHTGRFTFSTRIVRPTNPGTWSTINCRGEMWEGRDTLAKARETAHSFIRDTLVED